VNTLLFGHAADERIVAVRQAGDRTMRVYFRLADGIRSEDAPFFPFFFLSDRTLLDGFSRKHWLKRLEGEAFFQHLCVFEEWTHLWDAIRFAMDRHNRSATNRVTSYTELAQIHFIPDPVSQYLLQTGRTLFKGMEFAELHRLQLDIETYAAPPHRFGNPERAADRIILIALADSTGWRHLLDGRKLSEPDMLRELLAIVQERDPDAIEGHNIYGFDLPYLQARFSLHGIPPALGRDGTLPTTFESRTAFAERSFDYTVTDIPGRHVIDTLLLVQNYDMVRRNMESHGLKYAAQYFGFAAPERTYIAGDRISWHWDNNPEPLLAYAMDDVEETGQLSERLSGSSFYLSRIMPHNYGHVARMGSAAKIESLMTREYLRRRHALPQPQQGEQTTGGYTDIFMSGVVGPVLHVDVESLYPSIMITGQICPSSDRQRVFPDLLRELTALRLETKKATKSEKDPAARSRLDAMQASFKILINSFYGYLGYARALFNEFAAAERVTTTGQNILRGMIAAIESRGGRVVEVDTDGVFFVPPPGTETEQSEQDFVKNLSGTLPEGISLVTDGRYRRMLSYKKKNYALLEYDGHVVIKGSSLISRSMERFGRDFLRGAVERLLNDDIEGLHVWYLDHHRRITERMMDIRDFARTETLRDTLQEYIQGVESGRRNRSAAYEVAIAQGRPLKPGAKVSFYIIGNDPSPKGFENCKSASEWDSNFPDENTGFYLRRLDDFSEKFSEFFQPQAYRSIFSIEDLFPFNSQGITPVVRILVGGADEEPGPGDQGEWGD
jgi:DNA polymerase, archaea type